MADKVLFHPRVADDLGRATAYYDEIAVGLGNRFRSQSETGSERSQLAPNRTGVFTAICVLSSSLSMRSL